MEAFENESVLIKKMAVYIVSVIMAMVTVFLGIYAFPEFFEPLGISFIILVIISAIFIAIAFTWCVDTYQRYITTTEHPFVVKYRWLFKFHPGLPHGIPWIAGIIFFIAIFSFEIRDSNLKGAFFSLFMIAVIISAGWLTRD